MAISVRRALRQRVMILLAAAGLGATSMTSAARGQAVDVPPEVDAQVALAAAGEAQDRDDPPVADMPLPDTAANPATQDIPPSPEHEATSAADAPQHKAHQDAGSRDEEADDPHVTRKALGNHRTTTGSIIEPQPQMVIEEDSEFDDDSFTYLISSGSWLRRGKWFGQAEAMLLHRSSAPLQVLTDQPLFVDNVGTFFSDVMTTQSSGFGYEPGLRVTVGKYLGRDDENRDRTLEFSFYGLTDWNAQYAVSVAPVSGFSFPLLRTPLDRGVGAFNFSTRQDYTYASDLNSFEMNAKITKRLGRDRLALREDGYWDRECTPGMTPSFLAGFRLMTIDEDFVFSALRVGATSGSPTTPVAIPNADGRYAINAQNRLVGLQLGAELTEQRCNWSLGARGKLGGYANFASQHSIVHISDASSFVRGSEDRDESASDEQLTFAAEIGLVGSYQLRPNVALRASYDFMYLQGLALAPQQLNFNAAPIPFVRTGSHMFLDGASVGLEVVW